MAQPVSIRPLAHVDGKTLDQLKQDVADGGRFVVFQYTISLFAVTLRRMTAAHFIPAGQSGAAYMTTPNTLSLIFGWWCIPWGPIRTLQSLKLNKKGGIDVTKDVMLNLTEEDLAKNRVAIKHIATTVVAPKDIDCRELTRGIRKYLDTQHDIDAIYYGLYVNTDDPHFVLGIDGKDTLLHYTDDLKAVLYKYFFKDTHFLIIDMQDKLSVADELLELNLKVTRG